MKTFFAPAERTDQKALVAEITMVNKSPVVSGLLHSIGGLLAILDEHRQIISINDSFLKMLGIDEPSEALGLRPGEALKCIHSDEEPGGCGTTKFCSTCGTAIAIVSSLKHNKPSERICALTANRGGLAVDISLLVRSQPIEINGTIILLLFVKDITVEQQRAALERTFFHDINNMLGGLLGASEMLSLENNQSDLVKIIHKSSLRLKNELDIQKCLSQNGTGVWNKQPIAKDISQRIFQRNFSTKEGAGRGVGTYSMKLFGEQILGGKVNFTTSKEKGTVFSLSLPR